MYDRNNQLVFFFYRNHTQEPVRYSNQSCQLSRAHVWIDHTWHFTFELRRKMLTRRHRKIILYLDSFEDAQTNVFLFFCLLTIERYVTFIWNIFQVIDICILPLYLFCISAFGRLKGKIKKTILSRFFLCNQSCLADMIFLLFFVAYSSSTFVSHAYITKRISFSHLFEKNFHLKLNGMSMDGIISDWSRRLTFHTQQVPISFYIYIHTRTWENETDFFAFRSDEICEKTATDYIFIVIHDFSGQEDPD